MSIYTGEMRPGDEAGIIGLLENVFGGWPSYHIDCSLRDYWNWKYRENPIKKDLIVVSKIEDKVIGSTST